MRPDNVLKAIYEHAEEVYPNECCGIVTAAGVAVPLENVSETPRRSFRISPNDYLMYAKGALFMYHSHPDREAIASGADVECAEYMRLPLMIVSWPQGEIRMIGNPGEGMDLIGRRFIYGAFDCYSLVRDYHRLVLGHELPEITRPRFGWWEAGNTEPFIDGARACGMVEVDHPETGDLIMFSNPAYPVTNHIAVYVGGSEILQHRMLGLSSFAEYDDSYRDMTTKIMRKC